MKKIFLVLFMAAITLLADQHLMLYFDINKTLIASDQVEKKSEEDILNQLLAAKYVDRWDASCEKPITYDDYVRTVLLPGKKHDRELKKQRQKLLEHFVDYLREQQHPLYPQVLKTYTVALEKLHHQKGRVFSSFFRLLHALDEKGISYTLILRSFGEEVFDVAEEINAFYGKKFLHKGKFKEGTLLLDTGQKAKTASEVEELLHESSHTAIQDDWHYWMEGEMKSHFGKPFPVSHTDCALFFDDNIDLEDDESNIIAPVDVETGLPASMKQLADQHQIVAVDTLEAILDDNYFFEKVKTVCNNL